MKRHTHGSVYSSGQLMPEVRGTRHGDGEWTEDEYHLDVTWQYSTPRQYTYGASKPSLRPEVPPDEETPEEKIRRDRARVSARKAREAKARAKRKAEWAIEQAKRNAAREADRLNRERKRALGLRHIERDYTVPRRPRYPVRDPRPTGDDLVAMMEEAGILL